MPSGDGIMQRVGDGRDEYFCHFSGKECLWTRIDSDSLPATDINNYQRQMKYVKPAALFHELLTSGKRGRLIGLDVGDKYVGLSVSETCNKIAAPFSVLLRKKSNIGDIATDFQTMIKKLSLAGLVVGYPFDIHKNSPNAVQVKIFIDDLMKTEQLEGVKYTYWDESFTSKGVELLIDSVEMHPLEYKTAIDKFAAVKILQEYLDQMNRKSVSRKEEENLEL